MRYDFLQSDEWRKFQEAVGRKTFCISGDGFWANIVEHKLPIVGGYFYVPRGPIINDQLSIINKFSIFNDQISKKIQELITLAKENNIGWIRFDASDSLILDLIRENWRVVKAPHDMQPREVFVIDISKSEEELLVEMKSKTRYNIRLAEKKGVSIFVIPAKAGIQSTNQDSGFPIKLGMTSDYVDEFLRLNKIMARRQNIMAHPENYYRKMLEAVSPEILKLYIAEYQGKIIVANLMVFYGNTCTYLHGASDEKYRNAMAPYLLQWQAIKDAKKAGCKWYDMGGVKISNFQFPISKKIQNSKFKIQNFSNNWQGITKFKIGFSPKIRPMEFLGSYDIVINRKKYYLYRIIQKIKSFL